MQNYSEWLLSQQAIQRLVARLPRRPRATDDFEWGVKQMSRDAAIGKRYLQVGGDRLVGYLALDLDHPGAAFTWEQAGLLQPTIITISASSRAHYLYELEAPVAVSLASKSGPSKFLGDVRSRFVEVLSADNLFSGQITKNPLHKDWKVVVVDRAYQLAELKECIEGRKSVQRRQAKAGAALDSKNCFVFDVVRQWAYLHANQFECQEELFAAVRLRCAEHNVFSTPLPGNELNWIAKSVAKWVWPRRDSFNAHGERRTVSAAAIENIRRSAESFGRQYKIGMEETLRHYLAQVAAVAGIPPTVAKRARKEILSTIGS